MRKAVRDAETGAAEVGEEMLSTEAKLNELVNRLKELGGGNLHSVLLYGSAARGDFHDEHSDINVLCILASLTASDLRRIAPAVRWWTSEQGEPAPLFFTEAELQRSADVFAIELLDIRDAHRVLYGKDPVATINIPMNLHRVELEHELRTTLLKLRQHFLRSADNPDELANVLAQSTSSVLTLFRHVLMAFDETPPVVRHDLVARVAALADIDCARLEAALQVRDTGPASHDVAAHYGAYFLALEKVIALLDHHVPKHEWQRVAKA
jgi:predicted nucleotidyltransferase